VNILSPEFAGSGIDRPSQSISNITRPLSRLWNRLACPEVGNTALLAT
jgi:hypothetical protein